jgi:hypothetical protein
MIDAKVKQLKGMETMMTRCGMDDGQGEVKFLTDERGCSLDGDFVVLGILVPVSPYHHFLLPPSKAVILGSKMKWFVCWVSLWKAAVLELGMVVHPSSHHDLLGVVWTVLRVYHLL